MSADDWTHTQLLLLLLVVVVESDCYRSQEMMQMPVSNVTTDE